MEGRAASLRGEEAGLAHPLARAGSPEAADSPPAPRSPPQPQTLWRVPALRRTTDVPLGPDGLTQLALQGSWRAIIDRLKEYRVSDPEAHLTNAAFVTLGFVKLRAYAAAAEELKRVGNLDAPNKFTATATGPVSKVPFALRWLAAALPGLQSKPGEAIDVLYRLLDFCSRQLASAAEGAAPAAPTVGGVPADAGGEGLAGGDMMPDDLALPQAQRVQLWRRRQQMAVCALVTQHTRAKDFMVAFKWLSWLLRERGNDARVLAKVGCVQLAMGDVAAAERTFQRTQEWLQAAAGEGVGLQKEDAMLLLHNRGLLLFAQQDYAGAMAEFDKILEMEPSDATAANNKAVCHMYACQLTGAVATLEAALQEHPFQALQEQLVLNLCSMYELGSTGYSTDAKRKLSAWASRFAPDDFDLSCTRTS